MDKISVRVIVPWKMVCCMFIYMACFGCLLANTEPNYCSSSPKNFDVRVDDFSGVATIPYDVRYIGDRYFFSQEDLREIRFCGPVESIGESAFSRCQRLQEVIVPHTVTNIGSKAFWGCRSLTNIVICANIDSVPWGMCGQCWKLKHVELPASLVEIACNAFQGCFLLQEILIPDGVQNIERGAFSGCHRLQKVILPKQLKRIGPEAFYRCSDLRYLLLPPNLERIEEGALDECFHLEGLIIEGDIPVADANLLRDVSEKFSIYLVGEKRRTQQFGLAEYSWGYGRNIIECKDRDDALKICEQISASPTNGSSSGLKLALRMAVEGFLSCLLEADVNVQEMELFAANLPDLSVENEACRIVRFINQYASFPLVGRNEKGEALCAIASFGRFKGKPVRLEVSFDEGTVTNIFLSEGLKDGVILGLKMHGEKADEKIRHWLQ